MFIRPLRPFRLATRSKGVSGLKRERSDSGRLIPPQTQSRISRRAMGAARTGDVAAHEKRSNSGVAPRHLEADSGRLLGGAGRDPTLAAEAWTAHAAGKRMRRSH